MGKRKIGNVTRKESGAFLIFLRLDVQLSRSSMLVSVLVVSIVVLEPPPCCSLMTPGARLRRVGRGGESRQVIEQSNRRTAKLGVFGEELL